MNIRRLIRCGLFLALAMIGSRAFGQSVLVESGGAASVFPGTNRMTLVCANQGSNPVDAVLQGTVFLGNKALLMPLPIETGARLRLFPYQTALLPVSLTVPEFHGENRLWIRWQMGSRVVGKTELIVHPPGLLRELESMAGDPIGIASDDEDFKNAFVKSGLKFSSLALEEVGSFDGSLLIVSSASSQVVKTLAKRGKVVICIAPSNDETPLRPSFFSTPLGPGVVVTVREDYLRNFDSDPQAQIRLLRICRMALCLDPAEIPTLFLKDSHES